ncbi:YidH family protein [Microbacterium indicum]|uniref:YidH family protein n=1 Tax=Microbacterium indicum TaxID=358100 RepID=UPI000429AAE2|nr:DUF202 domain-containing protein [Microbacterium indicum]
MNRFPRRVYRDGEEPDPRFSLANERTFLAWLRTALAMFAGAFALEALALPAAPGWRLAAAAVFIVVGLLSTVHAWLSWARTEKAMRVGRPLPGQPMGLIIVVGIAVAVALVVVGTLIP